MNNDYDYKITSTLISRFVKEPVSKYETIYRKFEDKEAIIPQFYLPFFDALEIYIKTFNKNASLKYLQEANYIVLRTVNVKKKNIEIFNKFVELFESQPKMFKDIEYYEGKTLAKIYAYDPIKDGYSKKILVTLKPHFITKWRTKKYFYYVLPSSTTWKREHIKAFYVIGNEILKDYEETKDSEFRVIHVPQNEIFKGIKVGPRWNKEIRDTIKAFAIHVFDRVERERIYDVIAQIEEFDGIDEFLDF